MPESDILSYLKGRLDLVIVLLYCAFMGFGFGLVLHNICDMERCSREAEARVLNEIAKMRRDLLIIDNYNIEAKSGENVGRR